MTNNKAQMTKKGVALALKHLDFVCHLDFVIWILTSGDCHFLENAGK
jgi:hypothetical protein